MHMIRQIILTYIPIKYHQTLSKGVGVMRTSFCLKKKIPNEEKARLYNAKIEEPRVIMLARDVPLRPYPQPLQITNTSPLE